MQVITITSIYDAQEDRIALSVADAEKDTRKLWLSRNMLNRLVPALCDGLEKQIKKSEDASPDTLSAAQHYAQLQARISQKPAQAVQTNEQTPQGLVTAIDIKDLPDGGKAIFFRCGQSVETATMQLNANSLRQWLDTLKNASTNADWGLDIWPEWMQRASNEKT